MNIKYAGTNTVSAIMNNIKGDMSKLTNAVIPTFEDIYLSMESIDEELELLKTSVEYVTAEEAESWFN